MQTIPETVGNDIVVQLCREYRRHILVSSIYVKNARVRRQKQREPTMTKHFPDMLTSNAKLIVPIADPDLELRGEGGGFLSHAQPAFLPSEILFFLPKIRRGGPLLDPPLSALT